ncbi:hypothetical protein ACQQ2N_18020 [Dokdonella sp. MW10]|uniref:hypothetical protein n=1 Tax=Dokdonella sp. MW10 TaxID=2992926 RepID=UPI003F800185
MFPRRLSTVFVLATMSIQASAAPAGTVSGQSADGVFKPTHAYAWSESSRAGATTTIYLFDRAVPADEWADAEDRNDDILAWRQKASAPLLRWSIKADGNVEAIYECDAGGACSVRGVNVINDLASAVAKLKTSGTRVTGTLEEGSGSCNGEWCDVLGRYTVDVPLAPPSLVDRTLASGVTTGPDVEAARAALLSYWTAAGKAKSSKDIEGSFTETRRADARRQAEQYGAEVEHMFVHMFVPAHSGKPAIGTMRVLGDAAVAQLKAQAGSAADRYEMQCDVLMRKEGGTWKVGIERC